LLRQRVKVLTNLAEIAKECHRNRDLATYLKQIIQLKSEFCRGPTSARTSFEEDPGNEKGEVSLYLSPMIYVII
jgi:hypothetical protein